MTGTHPENRRIGYARVSTYGQTLDDGEQVEGAAGEAVDARHRHHIAGREDV